MGLSLTKPACRYRPVGGNVFVRIVKRERRSKILRPDSNEDMAQLWEGVVVRIGAGRLRNNAAGPDDRIAPSVKVGDRIVFMRNMCINVDEDSPDIFLVGEDSIISIRDEVES